MKLSFLILLNALLITQASQAQPPRGEQVLEIFFKHLNVELTEEKEPLCAMHSFHEKHVTLGEHLALVLSSAFEQTHITTLKASCEASKQEVDKELINSWDCQLYIKDSNAQGEYIASSSIRFALDQKDLKWLPGSLRCF